MAAPHKKLKVIDTNQVDQVSDFVTGDRTLHLVPKAKFTTNDYSKIQSETNRINLLEEQVRHLTREIAVMTSLIDQKEKLIQNFHVREQELKASFYRPSL